VSAPLSTVHVALFYARLDGRAWDQLVSVFSGFGPYAHAELVFSDGVSFSSTSMDQPPGPRFKRIDYSDARRWKLVPIHVTKAQEKVMRDWAEANVKACVGYDWSAIWGFVPCVRRFCKPDPARWMCSEIVLACLRAAGLLCEGLPAHRVSPNRLAKMLATRF
jgi:hypothetical protein